MLIVAFGVAVEDIDIRRLPGEPMWVSVPRAYRGNIRLLLMQASRVCNICVFCISMREIAELCHGQLRRSELKGPV